VCVQQRKRAWRLVEVDGLTCEQAAARMRVSPARAGVLVAQERDRLELKRHRKNFVAVACAREILDRELARNPELTLAEVSHWVGVSQIDLERQLGYAPKKNGQLQRRVGIAAASRLMLALGRAPRELDGC
jgi:transposase